MNFEAHYSITYIDKYNFKLEHCLSLLIGMFVSVTVLISGGRQSPNPKPYCQWLFLKESHKFWSVWGPIKIDSVKISKFGEPTFLGKIILHIVMYFWGNRTKTLGGVRKDVPKKLSKIRLNWPLRPGPCPHDLGAHTLGYSIAIFPASFAKIGLREKGENAVTPGQQDHSYNWQVADKNMSAQEFCLCILP